MRGGTPEHEPAETAPVLWILGGLVGQIALIGFAGFSIATGVLFAATARGFGRGRLYLTFPIGVAISLALWLLFAKGLDLSLAGRAAGTAVLRWTPSPLLAGGLTIALQPANLLFAFVGVLLGTAVGVLPGIGPALTVALLLPVTFKLDPAGSLIMFAGIYYGGMYGGSTTSILLNTPGESASIVTALEGNKMARAGRGGPALATAAIGSFVAGTIATACSRWSRPGSSSSRSPSARRIISR